LRRGINTHNGSIEMRAAHRPVEFDVPKGEDAAVGRRFPIAVGTAT